MRAGPTPAEDARLKAVARYQLLDTPADAVYDAFAELARDLTGTSMAGIAIVDATRAWFKSHVGLAATSVPREASLGGLVVASGELVVVRDARADERFVDNPLVHESPNVRFCCGAPLVTTDGHVIGALCAFDTKPRTPTSEQTQALLAVARALMSALEARRGYLALFDAAHIDVFTIDPADSTIVFASRGACERLGYSLRELVGMPIYDAMPSITEEFVQDSIRRRRMGEEVLSETDLVRKDGSTYPVELRIDARSEGGVERIIAIAVDVSQRRGQKHEIDVLTGAINVAGDVILVYAVGEGGTLSLAYMNDAYTHQTGYARDVAIGKSLEYFRQAMPDDDGMRTIRSAIAHGEPAQAEIVSYRKDGSTYWNAITLHPVRSAETGRITHWVSIERDISDEVSRTSVLAEEHDRLLALTRAARRLFTSLDARALVATVREVVAQLLGARAQVMAVRDDGASIAVDELGPTDWEGAERDDLVGRAVAHRIRVLDETETRAAAYAGRFGDASYVIEVCAQPARTLRGTDLFVFDLVAEYFAVAARNVSLYHELDERRSAVLELNQTKSDLIAMLAHDFRGPLTSIVGFADLTSEVGDVNEEQVEFLDTIKRSAMQLSDLATDTLTLSRLERNEVALTLSDVDVAELVRSVAQQSSDRREVSIDVAGDTHVTGDDERLRQVFSNLIDNAIKYTPDGPGPQVRVEGEADRVVVSVRDFGIGIPAGEVSRVFDRFSRASNARKMRISGTGFGLFLTKQLVQLHGGTIAVESEEGKGSVFTVTLPRRVDRSAAPRTVVVLDADRDRSFLAYGLQEAGYRVVTATALEEVLAAADAQTVDVIIIATPEELSRATTVQLRAFSRERAVPTIAIGGSEKSQLGAAMTLQRPVSIGDLVAALERLLER